MQATAPVLPAARDRILDAAEQLVADQGASSLTLDAVAQAAGVSKGGLLYHYPNKDALLAAMIERHCDDLDERCARELEGLPADQPSSRLKASILGVLTPRAGREDLGAALLAAAANKPCLARRRACPLRRSRCTAHRVRRLLRTQRGHHAGRGRADAR